MKSIFYTSQIIAMIFIVSCGNPQASNQFDITPEGDTINLIDANGFKQGLWLMPISKDTMIWLNDTGHSTARTTSGEVLRLMQNQGNKHVFPIGKVKMKLEVEISSVAPNGYTIAWYDTLGKAQNLDLFKRPYEVVCDIMDTRGTAGSYHGLEIPSTWTSFGTKDSVITVYFSVVRKKVSGVTNEKQLEHPDISYHFAPVQFNVRSQLKKRIELISIEL